MESQDKPDKAITLQVLADEVGVSIATVSNAYNRPDKLSAELREQVFKVAQRLGYGGPNPVARGLRTQKTGAVGWILFESLAYAASDPVTLLFFQGMADEFATAGVNLLIVPSTPDTGPSPDAVRGALVDGFVAYSLTADDPGLVAALERPVPTVIVEQPIIPGRPMVLIDSSSGAKQASAHLAELGHRRIAVLVLFSTSRNFEGPRNFKATSEIQNEVLRERLEGYIAGLKTSDITLHDLLIYECRSTVESGRAAMKWLLEQDEPPTAVLAMSDLIAIGAMQEAQAQGLDVPADISVIGFDDAPESTQIKPPLTTIRQPLREKGRLAAQLLLEPSDPPRTMKLETEFIIRESTGPAPSSNR